MTVVGIVFIRITHILVHTNYLFTYSVGFVERTPECISTNLPWEEMNFVQHFYDAFHLSWTTFSTVGKYVKEPEHGHRFRSCSLIIDS